jgi:hypothetical protein
LRMSGGSDYYSCNESSSQESQGFLREVC